MAEHNTTDLSPTNSVMREKVLRIIKHKTLDEEAATELAMSLITEAETKARIDELQLIRKDTLGKPATPENMDNATWQSGFRFARNGLSRYKNARINGLKG